jgi:putative membrane protein
MKKNLSIYIIIILHVIGIIGSIIPATSSMTISLTPANLLISSFLLIIQTTDKKAYLFFIVAFTIGMVIEIIGVKTGWPFGEYSYGQVLGVKFMGVPLTIGVNWLMLSYSIGVITRRLIANSVLAVIAGATFMVGVDLLIEPVAIKLGYWSWAAVEIPFSNYAAWWIISLLILTIFNLLLHTEKNKLTLPLIFSQLVYFTCILIFS